jgi:DHA1 family bicyclomycin/chloramphenicol resistance-like MFS transporter
VISVSPMLAPLTGAGLLVLGGWRAIFWAIVLVTAGSFAVAWFLQPETLKPEARVPVNLRNLVKGSRVLFSDPVFMGLTFVGGFGMASFFVFLASASFVYSGQFGLSPTQFGLAFAFNAVGFFGASQVAAPLGMRFGMVPVMRRAVWGFAAATVTLFALALAGVASLPVVMGMLFLGNACLGLVIPTTMVMALDPHGAIAGLASSLGGTLQMVTGGVMIVASAPFFDGTVVPMSGAIALCGVAALAVAQAMMGRVSEPSGEAG